MQATLRIFITDDCQSCDETYDIATQIKAEYPQLAVEIIDMNNPEDIIPKTVFATPTFMLNDRVVSLGNPRLSELSHLINQSIC